MIGFKARIDFDPSARMFAMKFVNGDGDVIAEHGATPRGMSNLARGLDVQAHEARLSGRCVDIVLPGPPGSDDGYQLCLTARSTEILADQIMLALAIAAYDMKTRATAVVAHAHRS